MMHRLTDRLTISGALAAGDLPRLAAQGFRTIVDLRSDGEPRPQGLAPWDEATLAREAGLAYRQIPVEPQLLGDALAHAVRNAVGTSTGPVLLHCTTGRRAGTRRCARALDVDGKSVQGLKRARRTMHGEDEWPDDRNA